MKSFQIPEMETQIRNLTVHSEKAMEDMLAMRAQVGRIGWEVKSRYEMSDENLAIEDSSILDRLRSLSPTAKLSTHPEGNIAGK